MKKEQKSKDKLNRLREIAEDMFIRLDKSGREIAEQLDVSEQTVSSWKKGREGEQTWDERQRDFKLTPLKLKELLLDEAKKLARGEESNINADKLSKLMSVIEKLDKSVSPRVVMNVFRSFDNFIKEIEPSKIKDFREYQRAFISHLISLES
jgi:transposase